MLTSSKFKPAQSSDARRQSSQDSSQPTPSQDIFRASQSRMSPEAKRLASEQRLKVIEEALSPHSSPSPSVAQRPTRTLTGSELRLKAIEKALSDLPRFAPSLSTASSSNASQSKRGRGPNPKVNDPLPSGQVDSFSNVSLASSSTIPKASISRDKHLSNSSSSSTVLSGTPTKPKPSEGHSQISKLDHPSQSYKGACRVPPDWHDSLSHPKVESSSTKLRTNAPTDIGVSSFSNTTTVTALSNISTKKQPGSKKSLSHEQTQILRLVQAGESVFYTGSAGTGKSVLLREIIKVLRKKYAAVPDSIAITASTGIAACNIGGVTLHSFAGIGLGVQSAAELVTKVKKNKKSLARWMRTSVLIIDEVSMVDGDLFDKLAEIATVLRDSSEPFGGIQVVVTGDFFQLPPVTKGSQQVKFAFEAKLWKPTVKHTYNLTKVFRQSDPTFVDMLNELRFGILSTESITAFKSLSRNIEYEDGISPTELFPRREDVERSNFTRISCLQTQEKFYIATDGGSVTDRTQREKMLSNFMALQKLTLRVDAQVMLIKNIDEGLVNGSMGRILSFVDPDVFGSDAYPDDSMRDDGLAGVGHPSQPTLYPLVEFVLPQGGMRRLLVMPEVWKVELPNGEVQVSRRQLPLILSWAMSIHKSQGQTLERVRVDLGKVFEKGQAYVALSRATSLEGLKVLNFDANKIQAHPKVVAWSETLSVISNT